jgi:hypothetical protein
MIFDTTYVYFIKSDTVFWVLFPFSLSGLFVVAVCPYKNNVE